MEEVKSETPRGRNSFGPRVPESAGAVVGAVEGAGAGAGAGASARAR